jgi:hypothetical protein
MVRRFFSHALRADLLAGRRCPQCDRLDPPLAVLDPEITEHEDVVELRFATLCACGRVATFELKLPALMLGYVLVHDELRRAAMPPQCRLMVKPKGSGLFEEFVRTYVDLLDARPRGSLPPTPIDEVKQEPGEPARQEPLRLELEQESQGSASP